jgi:NAD(P)-dependent dehydrogenase (short-subunit alcohol dehydrogenase family)
MSKRIILSISSDFGLALAGQWLASGHEIIGTYRSRSDDLDRIENQGATVIKCDLTDSPSVRSTCTALGDMAEGWDTMVIAPGLQDPIAMFSDCDFGQWASSLTVNFTAQMEVLHALLPLRAVTAEIVPSVILFAGGGTNSATVRYSAYTIAKIASIKMCELLDAEMPDTKFTIIGPGWVKTKIHEQTLTAGEMAGGEYERTQHKLSSDECVPMEQVVSCVDWVIGQSRDVVGGRNISLVYDDWGSDELNTLLQENTDMYKLRRNGNDVLVRSVPVSGKSDGETL